ncbi:hypothetical protein Gorai_014963, partial [Gossypium raimondii]|nr:hypothetical protein [Gossypium raimondii]
MFEDDGTARTKLLMHLGFSLPEEKDTVQDNISQIVNDITLEDKVTEKVGYEGEKEAAPFAVDNGEDFFNNLPSPKADTPVSTSENNFAVESTVSSTDLTPQEPEGVEESSDPSFDDAVQRALVVGDYKGAVAQCIAANKMADALVIAHVGDPSLWASTCDQYLKMSCSPYLKVVSAMVNNDLMSLVNTRPLKFWKETLALLCTFAQREEWTVLCDTLASKLMASEIWSRCLTTELDGKSYVDLLQDLMEKTIALALATGQKRFSASLCKLVEKYAEILASQGLLTTAMEYLKLLGSDDLSLELVILKDRIALSTEPVKEGKSAVFENSHPTGVPGFEPSQHDPAVPQIQPSVPGSAYDENYQRSFSQYGGYAPPPSYLPQAPPANMFVPTQAPHISQVAADPTYPAPPGAGSFAPVPSQMGAASGPRMPQVVAPAPAPRGFMPVTNTSVQRPGMGPMQPPSTTQSAPVQPAAAPAAPPPTVQTADTSNVPG